MKSGIHPEYRQTTISCACGNLVELYSTAKQLHVDVCSKCHPYYTGKRQQLVDRGGRIEQFNKRYKTNRGTPVETDEAVANG